MKSPRVAKAEIALLRAKLSDAQDKVRNLEYQETDHQEQFARVVRTAQEYESTIYALEMQVKQLQAQNAALRVANERKAQLAEV